MKRISFIFGTRPEAIKLCPLILALRESRKFQTHICVTAQHREMLDQVLGVFGIVPDIDLELMRENQSLSTFTSRALPAIDQYLSDHIPDMVLVQGDTTTVFCAALASFYHQVPVGHVEAGLRTWNKFAPYPEEINRVLTTHMADFHFAPTQRAKENLLKENVPAERIYVTGNTVIDALYIALDKVGEKMPAIAGLPEQVLNNEFISPMVLITGHRRENFGRGFENICIAVTKLAQQFRDTAFVYPVHLNPNVREPVFRMLGGLDNVYLIEPLSYLPFVALMNKATIILTDSGGVQEEAPSLGKPVLVMREVTERPEAVEAGTVKLVGANVEKIVNSVTQLLTDSHAYAAMAQAINPYGDGQACGRIVNLIAENL